MRTKEKQNVLIGLAVIGFVIMLISILFLKDEAGDAVGFFGLFLWLLAHILRPAQTKITNNTYNVYPGKENTIITEKHEDCE